MYRVAHGATGTARVSLIRRDGYSQDVIACYEKVAPRLVAKTGTAEIIETLSPDPEHARQLKKHVWFGGIVYPDAHSAQAALKPELIIVVFFRYAHGGREGAVVAAQLADEWRRIQANF
jgi:cell division protein FtsI/penicillin-binding protein 2